MACRTSCIFHWGDSCGQLGSILGIVNFSLTVIYWQTYSCAVSIGSICLQTVSTSVSFFARNSVQCLFCLFGVLHALHMANLLAYRVYVNWICSASVLCCFVMSGEVFDYLVAHGRMKEKEARAKFRQVLQSLNGKAWHRMYGLENCGIGNCNVNWRIDNYSS